ncbi:choline-sulfatase [Paracoccus sp. Z330]|uniref:Choline-sulfatase n=1 Tax=Paracoccus onchidii TaxID=3017813 RepID=A0ABT4ZGJ9_9RHOB|nr:choline-sulfatase [Paracoccus onchidii]MDB6178431.1 choline-sulfatase [Paracoccus onchidii]
MSKKPNILLIEADQLAAFVLSMYRPEAQAITPNLDRLAADGVVFENAYSNSPLCCPSRASKFTGRLPSSHEVWGNGAEFRSELPTMMHFLRSAGYRCVVSGKCHFIGADQLHGFDKRLTTDMYPSGFDWTIDWKLGPVHREGTSTRKLGVSGLCKTNNQILYDAEVQYRAVEFLRYEALNKPESPFFLHVSYTQPHEAYQSLPEYWDRYDGIEIEMPRIPEDDDPHPTTAWLKIHHGIDQFPPDAETIRLSRRAYYAMISHLDDYLGELIAELKHLGLYDDTVIVFTSDHGDMLGERGMWFKRSFYQGSLQVPMIVHGPGIAAGRRSQNVTLADLCPTLAELGGAKAACDTHGSSDSQSFLGLLMADSNSVKDEAIAEYYGPGVIEPWLAIRKGDWKYVWTRNHPDLLYNMKDDPDEQTDLSDDPALAEIRDVLRQRLLARYDVEAVTQRAAVSKTTRAFLQETLSTNESYAWDYEPRFDATRRYVRGVNSPSTA